MRFDEYDPNEIEEYDPYDDLEDRIDELLQDDAYERKLPQNYNNGYGEGYDSEPDWDQPQTQPEPQQRPAPSQPRRNPPRQREISAYNPDYDKASRQPPRRTSDDRYSTAQKKVRASKRAGREKSAGRERTRGRHPILKILLALVILAILAVAALWIFAKQPISDQSIGTRKSGCSTILLAGTDVSGNRTDTMLLLYLDSKNGEMSLLSLPRDTYTSGSWNVPKLNAAYGVNGGGEEGMEALLGYAEQCIGYRPDGYLLVDLDCFIDLVDAMGGVDFDVPTDMEYYDYDRDKELILPAGLQHLDGDAAELIVRFRSGYALADLQRIQVQRDFLKTAMKQWTSPKKLLHYPAALKLLSANTTTDLSLRNLVWIGKAVMAARGKEMSMDTLPGEAAMIGDGSYYVLWPEATARLINSGYNPYETDVSASSIYSPWY